MLIHFKKVAKKNLLFICNILIKSKQIWTNIWLQTKIKPFPPPSNCPMLFKKISPEQQRKWFWQHFGPPSITVQKKKNHKTVFSGFCNFPFRSVESIKLRVIWIRTGREMSLSYLWACSLTHILMCVNSCYHSLPEPFNQETFNYDNNGFSWGRSLASYFKAEWMGSMLHMWFGLTNDGY